MRTAEADLIESESQRIASIELNSHNALETFRHHRVHFHLATAHTIATFLSLGRATEIGWVIPAILTVVSCWDFCRSLSRLPEHLTRELMPWQIAGATAAVVLAASTAIALIFSN